MWSRRWGRLGLGRCAPIAVSLFVITACTVGPDYVRPQTSAGEHYGHDPALAHTLDAGSGAQRLVAGGELPADWWTLFKSPRLDAEVAAAVRANPTLQAAEASLRQSQDRLRAGYSVFYPRLDLESSVARERLATAQPGGASGAGVFNLFTLGGTIGYMLDLFGGGRRTVEVLQAQAEEQFQLARAAWLTLTATVVDTTIARAAYAEELRTLEQLIALQDQQLQAADAAWRAGWGSYAAVLGIRSLRDANQALVPALRQRVSEAGHLLVTLGGDLPSQAEPAAIDWADLSLPLEVPVSLPSALVRQRPDILAAEAALHAASAGIGVATAAMFPAISLNASYGGSADRFGGLAEPSSRFWSVGPALSLPVFQGGSLWYGREAALESWRASQGSYRQTVLTAFAQVADALDALASDARVLQAQEAAAADACEALDLLDAGSRAGTVAFSDVLAADVLVHQAQVARLQALAQRYQDTVTLFVALGGGWWNAPQSAPSVQGQ